MGRRTFVSIKTFAMFAVRLRRTQKDGGMSAVTQPFPAGFLWGAATSAHQVEGGNIHSDWWAWEQAGRVTEPSGDACRHYDLFESDFDLAASLHHNAHRFSIEWSRIEPAEGRWDDHELEHYRHVIAALRARHLEPIVTLHHFTCPQWFSERGGWEHPQALAAFSRYVRRVAQALGRDIRYWITFNEPAVLLWHGYLEGAWPPGQRSLAAAQRVLRQLARAHAAAYRIIHDTCAWQQPLVGVAHYCTATAPCRAGRLQDRLASHWRGQYINDTLVGMFQRAGADFVGVNYYRRDFIRWGGWLGRVCPADHHPDAGPRNALGWESYPPGLYQCLQRLRRYRLPILITENGVCATDDAQRWRFIRDHLQHVARAAHDGAPVIGYVYWSLLDNFEWAEGFGPRFGLIAVEYATQRRTVRPSALRYARVCQTNALPEA